MVEEMIRGSRGETVSFNLALIVSSCTRFVSNIYQNRLDIRKLTGTDHYVLWLITIMLLMQNKSISLDDSVQIHY